jgi:hypothetical protein
LDSFVSIQRIPAKYGDFHAILAKDRSASKRPGATGKRSARHDRGQHESS